MAGTYLISTIKNDAKLKVIRSNYQDKINRKMIRKRLIEFKMRLRFNTVCSLGKYK